MNIGCVGLVPVQGGFLGLNCAKGRGIILPGGKPEDGELYSETVIREVYEETGVVVRPRKLLFHAPDVSDFHCYTFLCQVMDDRNQQTETPEGKVIVTGWEGLMTSLYRNYYELLKEAYDEYRAN